MCRDRAGGGRWPWGGAIAKGGCCLGRVVSAFEDYLHGLRGEVDAAIRRIIPVDSPKTGGLYGRMIDYPTRSGKLLRPALAIATCRALGGEHEQVLPTAAALELFHNAFLIHDDVEDGSELRRHGPALHQLHGVPIAVNTGDGMLAVALQPLLDNVQVLGLSRALAVLDVVVRMVRETAEGQAMELQWIRDQRWDLEPRDYLRMVLKKTAWYSFIAPMVTGAIVALGVHDPRLRRLGVLAGLIGMAFQVQDDLLNLESSTEALGKERCGDLSEGKRTLMLLHAARTEPIAPILAQPSRSTDDVERLLAAIERSGGMAHARAVAQERIRRAERSWAELAADLPASPHRAFLTDLIRYVVERTR